MNKVILVGRLTSDPELRQTTGGTTSCRFSVAMDRKFVNKQTGERESDFIRCVAWGQTAEFVNRYFSKGKLIGIEGQLRSGSYQDKNHPDVTHYTTDVWVENVEFVGSKSESGGNSGNNNYNNNGYSAPQNNYSSAPQQASAPSNDNMSYGSINDYEEILSDGDVPF
ncbi:MAG: single-stranded DNA-binding protein [Ruminococcus sp.]|nr:single-stranded DNA-binding protein [Ruminococcus sp.]MDE6849631.1 single-stranded DNA-binding protein [Ruminococcus sp.]MDE7137226.1 single-stranded DNA-binding protein [Ruminococcus sp.]